MFTIEIKQEGNTKKITVESQIFQNLVQYLVIFLAIGYLAYLNVTPPQNPVVFTTYQVPVKPISTMLAEALVFEQEFTGGDFNSVPVVETEEYYFNKYNGVSTNKLAWVDNSQYMPLPSLPASQTSLRKLAQELMRNEGKVRGVYYDKVGKCGPRGCLTIGYGFCIHKPTCGSNKEKIERVIGRPVTNSTKMTDVEMVNTLNMFLGEFERGATRMFGYLKPKLSASQWETIIEMCYNGGCGGVKSKTKGMIAALARGDGQTAAAEFGRTGWCRQVGNRCKHYKEKLMRGAKNAGNYIYHHVANLTGFMRQRHFPNIWG